MIDKILSDLEINKIAKRTTKDNHFKDDLEQELYLELLEMDRNKLIRLYESDDLLNYVYKMAWNSYNGRLGRFFLKYRKQLEHEPNEGREIFLSDVVEDAGLNEMERMWLNTYLEHSCSFTWTSKSIAVSRRHVSKTIKEITLKCKK